MLCLAFFDRVQAGSGFVEAGVASRAGTVTLKSCVKSRWEHPTSILFDLFLAAEETHTLDLRFRHGQHAASVCLRFGFEDWFGSGIRSCDLVIDSRGELGVVVAASDDDDDGGEDLCEKRSSGKLVSIESACTLPGNIG
jgi:hypothetical protein